MISSLSLKINSVFKSSFRDCAAVWSCFKRTHESYAFTEGPLLPILFRPWRMSTKQRLHLKKISQTRQYYSRTEFTQEIGTLAGPKSFVPREAWPGHQWGGHMRCLSGGLNCHQVSGWRLDHLRINLSVKTKFKLLPSELQFPLSSHL